MGSLLPGALRGWGDILPDSFPSPLTAPCKQVSRGRVGSHGASFLPSILCLSSPSSPHALLRFSAALLGPQCFSSTDSAPPSQVRIAVGTPDINLTCALHRTVRVKCPHPAAGPWHRKGGLLRGPDAPRAWLRPPPPNTQMCAHTQTSRPPPTPVVGHFPQPD